VRALSADVPGVNGPGRLSQTGAGSVRSRPERIDAAPAPTPDGAVVLALIHGSSGAAVPLPARVALWTLAAGEPQRLDPVVDLLGDAAEFAAVALAAGRRSLTGRAADRTDGASLGRNGAELLHL
jgi:hypothetical protein